MKRILVTGGAGFIGSNFIRYMLKDKDYRIINLDALTYAGNLENLSGIEGDDRYQFVHGDVADADTVASVFDKAQIDYVVHFAAESHVDRSLGGPDLFIHTNVLGTQVLLEASKKHWMTGTDREGYPRYREGVKFLQISTDEVYGSLGQRGRFTEQSPLMPNSPYSASKASADMIVRAYHQTYKLPINITRCSNNYGPHQYPEKLIPLMIIRAMKNETLPVYGDGRQVRDWLHVDDHCRAIEAVLKNGISGSVYNIGGDSERTNIEIVRRILEVTGRKEELIEYVEDRLGHDRRYAVDHTLITNKLGWMPLIDFDKGIKDTISWYMERVK